MRIWIVALLAGLLACVSRPDGTDPEISDQPLPPLSSFPEKPLSECGTPLSGDPADVVLVIDTSRSTIDPTGLDVNANGVVSKAYLASFPGVAYTDPGDSYLAAQVVAARSVVTAAPNPGRRFGIVSFAGPVPDGPLQKRERDSPVVEADLTDQIDSLHAGLERILEQGSFGSTDFAGAIAAASRLFSDRSASERLVLFMADSAVPSVQGPGGRVVHEDPAIRRATRRAAAIGVRIYTFELRAPPAGEALESIAAATGGTYHAVSDLSQLHCVLMLPLAP